MKIVSNWLNSRRNFTIGAVLYKQLGNNQALINLLDKGETITTRKLLEEALQKIANQSKESTPVKVHAEADRESAAMPQTDNLVLEAIRNEWTPLYQRMNLLRHNLDKYGNSNSAEAIEYRKPIAKEIKDLERQCNAIWDKRDYYIKHGHLPKIEVEEFVIPEDLTERANLLNAIKRNIRRNRKSMLDNPDQAQYAQLYIKYKEQFKILTGKDYVEKNRP